MTKFAEKFITIIEQDEAALAAEPAANPERAAMAGTLDKGVSPEHYDIPAPRVSLNAEEKQRQLEELKQWIAEIDNFADFLNAPKQESIQSKLHAAGCDTLFEHIAKSEKKKLSRIAAELSTLSQSLKGYLISSNG